MGHFLRGYLQAVRVLRVVLEEAEEVKDVTFHSGRSSKEDNDRKTDM